MRANAACLFLTVMAVVLVCFAIARDHHDALRHTLLEQCHAEADHCTDKAFAAFSGFEARTPEECVTKVNGVVAQVQACDTQFQDCIKE